MKDKLKNKLKRLKAKSHDAPAAPARLAKLKMPATQDRSKLGEALARAEEAVEEVFIIIRDEKPELFEQFKEAAFTGRTSESIEEFYARIAQKDAYRAGKTKEPPPAFVMAKRPEYEMPNDYKRALEQLTAMIEERREYDDVLPTLPAETRTEATPVLRELDDAIEKLEQKLAEEYESFQEEKDREACELSSIKVKHWMRTARQFLFIKKYQPQALERFKAAFMEDEEDWIHVARWIDRLTAENYDPPPAQISKE